MVCVGRKKENRERKPRLQMVSFLAFVNLLIILAFHEQVIGNFEFR